MKDFTQFLEDRYNEADESAKPIKAVMDMAKALSQVFKRYTRSTRSRGWKQLTSPKGMRELDQIVRTPTRSLNKFRTLW